jgi:sulfofructose kinase
MMPELDVVGLGLACLDILVRTNDLPTWDHGVRLLGLGIDGGGPVATALVAAQKLGLHTAFVGTYGSDRLGDIKLQTLVEHGIDVSHALQRPGSEDQSVLVLVNGETGERNFSGFGGPRDFTLRVDELDREFITSAKILHLDGFHSKAALQAVQWMHQAGRKVMFDGFATHGPLSTDVHALVKQTDVLVCAHGFGEALTGIPDIQESGKAILDLGPSIVVQTEGKLGSYTTTREESFHTPAFDVEVLDTTGAGDVFHGAYQVGLLKGWDVRTIAWFSTAVAGMKCAHLGGRQGIPHFEQVVEFLHNRGIKL